MQKEVSDKIVLILVLVAILVSLFGTYLVYTNSNMPDTAIRDVQVITQGNPQGTGHVGLVVVNPEEGADNG